MLLADNWLPAAGDKAGEHYRQRRLPAQPRQALRLWGSDVQHQQGGVTVSYAVYSLLSPPLGA